MTHHVIIHEHRCPDTDVPLFWSNEDGWVDLASATPFTHLEMLKFKFIPQESWGWLQLPDIPTTCYD